MTSGNSGSTRCEMNVTPLVDVALVLLIIFMVVSPLMTGSFYVNIPRGAESPVEIAPPGQIVIQQKADGTLTINHQEIKLNRLSIRLNEILKGRTDRTVFFTGADDLNYGVAVSTMDLLRSAGANIGIITSEIQ